MKNETAEEIEGDFLKRMGAKNSVGMKKFSEIAKLAKERKILFEETGDEGMPNCKEILEKITPKTYYNFYFEPEANSQTTFRVAVDKKNLVLCIDRTISNKVEF